MIVSLPFIFAGPFEVLVFPHCFKLYWLLKQEDLRTVFKSELMSHPFQKRLDRPPNDRKIAKENDMMTTGNYR